MFLIRADGNAKIGAGHLMRCLTIVSEMEAVLGGQEEILFLCADEDSAELVKSKGFRARVLYSDYRDMEGELNAWERILAEEKILPESGCFSEVSGMGELPCALCCTEKPVQNVILVDSYYVTNTYLMALRKYGRVYLLDDMQREQFPVDGVMNYNAFASKEIYAKLYEGTDTACFVGSDYVPVRSQFLNQEYGIRDRVEDILITTGGGDVENIAGKIVSALLMEYVVLHDLPEFYEPRMSEECDSERHRNVMHEKAQAMIDNSSVVPHFHIVTGRYSPNFEALQSMAKQHENIHIYRDVQDMAALMRRCDLAITAGGTTIYELAAIGVPFICFSYAENQEALTEYIGEKQIAGYAGAYHKNSAGALAQIKRLVEEFSCSIEKRKQCFGRERTMIDGRGAKRLAEVLLRERYNENPEIAKRGLFRD